DLRHHTDVRPDVQEGPVTLGEFEQVDIRLVGRAGRRRRDALSANLPDQVHVVTSLLKPLAAAFVVVDGPLGEADGTLDRQSAVPNAFANVLQVAATFDVRLQVADPRLDALEARPGGDFDLFGQRQLLPHDGRGVQTVTEGLGIAGGFGGVSGGGQAGGE